MCATKNTAFLLLLLFAGVHDVSLAESTCEAQVAVAGLWKRTGNQLINFKVTTNARVAKGKFDYTFSPAGKTGERVTRGSQEWTANGGTVAVVESPGVPVEPDVQVIPSSIMCTKIH